MLMFLIMFLPLFLAVYCLKVRTTKIVPVVFIGVFSAVIVVIFKMLFLLSHRVVFYSFASNVAFCLVKESLIPVVVLYGLYFLIAKDNIEFKINTYLPLLLSFYSVYLPYCIISTTSSAYSWYSIFLKPIIYGIMIAQTGVSVRDLYRSFSEKKIIGKVYNIALILVYLILPSIIDAIYLMNYSRFVFILITGIYLILPVFLFLINKKVILDK